MPARQGEHGSKKRVTGIRHSEKVTEHYQDGKEPAARPSPVVAEAKGMGQFRWRILVVDDEPSIRETAAHILEGEGYEVLTAADGVEGLHALSKFPPDLIISDLNMPRMSGFELLAVVRERFPNIATIAISGEYVTGGLPSGILADAFLEKGHYTLKELFREIAKLLEASPARSGSKRSAKTPCASRQETTGDT